MAIGRKSGRTKRPKSTRKRDFRAEYLHRVRRGLEKGLSVSQARGHARAGERPRPAKPIAVNPKSKEETAVRIMKAGFPLRTAAKSTGISEQRLRRYIKENVGAQRVGNRWIFDDQRPRRVPMYSEQQLKSLVLSPFEASRAATYMHAVRQFLLSGEIETLAPFVGRGVTDTSGRFHPFEVDPNNLYELDAAGELDFPEIYKINNPGDE